MPFVAYIGIGSNQSFGDQSPGQLVAAAIHELEKLGHVSAQSSLYGTQPVGLIAQSAFINAAVEVLTSHGPEDLLDALIQIERGFGRDRAVAVPKGPRTLDLDLLFAISGQGEGIIHNSPSLTLPHPEAPYRRFVLAPLAEIAPDLRHPVLKKTIAELLAELPDEGSNAIEAVRVLDNLSGKAR
jgi:2-amino-4-hydroxy-6-hydroxymethyldihydropteridine diphosphokinase